MERGASDIDLFDVKLHAIAYQFCGDSFGYRTRITVHNRVDMDFFECLLVCTVACS